MSISDENGLNEHELKRLIGREVTVKFYSDTQLKAPLTLELIEENITMILEGFDLNDGVVTGITSEGKHIRITDFIDIRET